MKKASVTSVLSSFLILIAIVAYGLGWFSTIFNGDTVVYQIAKGIDRSPFKKIGWLVMLAFVWVIFLLEIRLVKVRVGLILLLIATGLTAPVYVHLLINEHQMETQSVEVIPVEDIKNRLDYSVLERMEFNEETKSYDIILNYRSALSSDAIPDMDPDDKLTDQLEHQLKQRLSRSVGIVANTIWNHTHKPKEIHFTFLWDEEMLFTALLQKKDRSLSYFDSYYEFVNRDNHPYHRFDIEQEGAAFYLNVRTDQGDMKTYLLRKFDFESQPQTLLSDIELIMQDVGEKFFGKVPTGWRVTKLEEVTGFKVEKKNADDYGELHFYNLSDDGLTGQLQQEFAAFEKTDTFEMWMEYIFEIHEDTTNEMESEKLSTKTMLIIKREARPQVNAYMIRDGVPFKVTYETNQEITYESLDTLERIVLSVGRRR